MKTKRAAIYVRVSTVEQDTGLQETELLEYVENRGWSYVVYRDHGQCGAKNDRPALTALLRRRKADVVVVWALDRLARSLKHLLTIAEECRLLGVDLVSLRQNIDTTLPAGRLTFAVLGAVAEFEREMLRERVKAGMAQARRAGKRVGRPALRQFAPSEIERMRQPRMQGTSVRKLATDFKTNAVDGRKAHCDRCPDGWSEHQPVGYVPICRPGPRDRRAKGCARVGAPLRSNPTELKTARSKSSPG
jgi:DNA invertase Pin-like site-specific DNA recombinase